MSHARAVSLMIIVTLLLSVAGVVTRHLDSAYSFEVTFWRSAFAAMTLAVALTLMRGPRLWISGLCWSIMFTCFTVAITLTTVANVLIVMALSPLVTALFARIFLHYRLPQITWLAIATAGFGIIWMFLHDGETTFSLAGTLVALAIPLAAAINYTIMQHVGLGKNRKNINPSDKPVQDMLPAILLGAIFSALVTLPLSWPFQASVHDLGLLSLLGIFQLALPCLLIVRLTRELPAPEISLLSLLEVIFGVTWAWLWAGEHLSVHTLSGGLLVIGALLVNEASRVFRERQANAHTLSDV